MSNYNKLYSFEEIADMLKDYKSLKRKVLQLKFEIEHFISTTEEDMIDAMTFGKVGEASAIQHSGQITDKTGNAAISYLDKARRLNAKAKVELERDLVLTLLEIERIDYYISILDKKYSDVLNKIYIEGKTYVDASKELYVSISTLRNLRREGIKELLLMFNDMLK